MLYIFLFIFGIYHHFRPIEKSRRLKCGASQKTKTMGLRKDLWSVSHLHIYCFIYTRMLTAKSNYTLLFCNFQCKCVLIKSSHVEYMATGVYRTIMSGRFDPTSVEYFDRTLLSNFHTSVSYIGILKTGLSLNEFIYTCLKNQAVWKPENWISSIASYWRQRHWCG